MIVLFAIIGLLTLPMLWHLDNDSLHAYDASYYADISYIILNKIQESSIWNGIQTIWSYRVWKQNFMPQLLLPFLYITNKNSLAAMELLALASHTIWIAFTYLSLRLHLSIKTSLAGILTIFTLPYFINTSLWFYPEIASLSPITISLYCLLNYRKNRDTKYLYASAIFLAFAGLFRPLISFFLLLPTYQILYLDNKITKKEIKDIVSNLGLSLAFIIPYLLYFYFEISITGNLLMLVYFIYLTTVFILIRYSKSIFKKFISTSIGIFNLWYLWDIAELVNYIKIPLNSNHLINRGLYNSNGFFSEFFQNILSLEEIGLIFLSIFFHHTYIAFTKKQKNTTFYVLIWAYFTLILTVISPNSELRFLYLTFYLISVFSFISLKNINQKFILLFYALALVNFSNIAFAILNNGNKYFKPTRFKLIKANQFSKSSSTMRFFEKAIQGISDNGDPNIRVFFRPNSKFQGEPEIFQLNVIAFENDINAYISHYISNNTFTDLQEGNLSLNKFVIDQLNIHRAIIVGPLDAENTEDHKLNPSYRMFKIGDILVAQKDLLEKDPKFNVKILEYKKNEGLFNYLLISKN